MSPRKKKQEVEEAAPGRLTYPHRVIEPFWLDRARTRVNPDALQDLMSVHRWTRRDLADYMGVTERTIKNWLYGLHPPDPWVNAPELERLVAITNRLLIDNHGLLPPEIRWIPPRVKAKMSKARQIVGSPPPEPQAQERNLAKHWGRSQSSRDYWQRKQEEELHDAERPKDNEQGEN